MRRIYILPNLFTAGSLFCGVLAIYEVFDDPVHDWLTAVQLIFLAGVLDVMDGFIARLTKTQSAFGMNFDSLADVVSFGVAPAVIVYTAANSGGGEIHLVARGACALYAVLAGVRLARFNVQAAKEEKKTFTGLPTPGAALTALSLFWLLVNRAPSTEDSWIPAEKILPFAMALLAYLMVSRFPYYGFKSVQVAKRHHDEVLVIILIVLVMLFVLKHYLDVIAAVGLTAYALSGPAIWFWQRRRGPIPAAQPPGKPAEPAAARKGRGAAPTQ